MYHYFIYLKFHVRDSPQDFYIKPPKQRINIKVLQTDALDYWYALDYWFMAIHLTLTQLCVIMPSCRYFHVTAKPRHGKTKNVRTVKFATYFTSKTKI